MKNFINKLNIKKIRGDFMYIIATVGPSTKEKRVIKEIVKAGANVLRLNFSHGSYEEFSKIIKIYIYFKIYQEEK